MAFLKQLAAGTTPAAPSTVALRAALASGALAADALLRDVYARIAARGARPIFIELIPLEGALAALETQRERARAGTPLPLFGIFSRLVRQGVSPVVGGVARCIGVARAAGGEEPVEIRLDDAVI